MKNTATTPASCICPKCGGSGKLDWTSNDGGVCYKCEGEGYLGEKPEGFSTATKQLKQQAKDMLRRALINRRTKGEKALSCSHCTGDALDAKWMLDNNIAFRFKYDKFMADLPDQSVDFKFDTHEGDRYFFTVVIGGEFVVIKARKA